MTITQSELQDVFTYQDGNLIWKAPYGQRNTGKVSGWDHNKGYRSVALFKKKYLVHRLIWLYHKGSFPTYDIDHINGDKQDNRIENLRDVPKQVNVENQRKAAKNNKSTGLLGVTKLRDKFLAQIQHKYKQVCLGLFTTAEEASIAYIKAKRELHHGCTI